MFCKSMVVTMALAVTFLLCNSESQAQTVNVRCTNNTNALVKVEIIHLNKNIRWLHNGLSVGKTATAPLDVGNRQVIVRSSSNNKILATQDFTVVNDGSQLAIDIQGNAANGNVTIGIISTISPPPGTGAQPQSVKATCTNNTNAPIKVEIIHLNKNIRYLNNHLPKGVTAATSLDLGKRQVIVRSYYTNKILGTKDFTVSHDGKGRVIDINGDAIDGNITIDILFPASASPN